MFPKQGETFQGKKPRFVLRGQINQTSLIDGNLSQVIYLFGYVATLVTSIDCLFTVVKVAVYFHILVQNN